MPYVGASLARCFDLEDNVKRLCFELADEGGDRLTDAVKEFTPVGKRPFEADYVPGALLASIEKKVTVVEFDVALGRVVYKSGTETNLDYSVYVENGTGLWGPARAKYEIRPKNPDGWLRFHDEYGNVVFAKRVMHPGSPGAHMFAKGVAKTEAEFHEWGQRKVDEHAKLWEAQIAVRGKERTLIS